MRSPVEEKVRRLVRGEPPRLLDLFSGCGGLTLGFTRAGCVPVAGVEMDPLAARSYATNFHSHDSERVRAFHATARDITTLDPARFLGELGHSRADDAIDILVGGPPCPTFTRVGRAKLREVHQHPEAFLQDPRSQLYVPYLRFVEAVRPVALLMENVPDFLNWGGHNLAEEICEVLEGLGYDCAYTLLNAASYGVPQMRERFFLMAIHRAAGATPAFPRPTCAVSFPSGYTGTRDVALKALRSRTADQGDARHVPTPDAQRGAADAVSVRDAIADLPSITGHLTGAIRRGARRFDTLASYRAAAPSAYARSMREWPGFESSQGVVDHVIRSLSDRDYRLFRAMSHGDDYPKAHALALRLFDAALADERKNKRAPRPGTAAYEAFLRTYVPPYDPTKFPNKWRKMEPDLPARTLMAHLGKDSYSHIHYDSKQARVLSVREAARLQSFPDGFTFCGTMNPAFRQVGNAVPPLLALRVAEAMLGALKASLRRSGGAQTPARSRPEGLSDLSCKRRSGRQTGSLPSK